MDKEFPFNWGLVVENIEDLCQAAQKWDGFLKPTGVQHVVSFAPS